MTGVINYALTVPLASLQINILEWTFLINEKLFEEFVVQFYNTFHELYSSASAIEAQHN